MMGNDNNIHFNKFPIEQIFSRRRKVLIGIAFIAIVCGPLIGLDPMRLLSGNNLKLAGDFMSAALSPAMDYENPVPGAEPFLITVVKSVLMTLRFALLAMSVSIPIGAILAFFSTTTWWPKIKNKRGLIMGVANERSIAWGIAKKLSEHGAELAFTYLGDALKKKSDSFS